jgi:hypothetical protein
MDDKLKLKWGIHLDHTYGAFLLGANINIGKYDYPLGHGERYGYICIYLGFRTLVIGKDYQEDKV